MTSAENNAPACVETQAGVSVSKKAFLPAWSRNTPSAQPVSVCFAPENRGPSSKQARFIRRWRRFACFPFLGFPRTPFLTVTENLPHLLTVTRPPAWKRRRAGDVWSAQEFFQIGLHGNGEPGQIVEPLGQIGALGHGHQSHREQFVHKGLASGSEQPKG